MMEALFSEKRMLETTAAETKREGRQEGIEEGREEMREEIIASLMKNLGVSREDALKLIDKGDVATVAGTPGLSKLNLN